MGEENLIRRLDALLKAASGGDAAAATELGDAYARGEGTVRNPKKAVHWYERGASQGLPEAMGKLGYCRLCGDGIAKDPVEGARLISASISKGDASGRNLYNLASCYEAGEGLPQDVDKAVDLYREAVGKGYRKAEAALRRMRRG